MWISERMAAQHAVQQEAAQADLGVTTIGGSSASVFTRGEQRELSIFGPKGLIWQPAAGDTVLVIRGGSGGEEQCVAAAEADIEPPENMEPGELFLCTAGGSSLYLKNDGSVLLTGDVVSEGPITAQGGLQVLGDLSVNGSLDVRGTVQMQGVVSIEGALIINGQTCPACGQ